MQLHKLCFKALRYSISPLLVLLLSGCQVNLEPVPVDVGITFNPNPPTLRVKSAQYKTNYYYLNGNTKRYVICDDLTTELTYTFEYEGNLKSWRSYLRGETTGRIRGERTYTLADPVGDYYVRDKEVHVTYAIQSGAAPRSAKATASEIELQPRSLLPSTSTRLGASNLVLDVYGTSNSDGFDTGSVPIYRCKPPVVPFEAYDVTYRTNHYTSSNQYIICDNWTTELTYSFRYQGDLSHWRSYLKGTITGEVRGDRTYHLAQSVADYTVDGNKIEVTYSIAPYAAPRQAPEKAALPQQRALVSPSQYGSTVLYLDIYNTTGQHASYDIPTPLPIYTCR